MPVKKKKGTNHDRFFGRFIIYALIIIGLLAIFCQIPTTRNQAVQTVPTSASTYRAVFLDNGEVYFGLLQNNSGAYLRLTDVYYLKVNSVAATSSAQSGVQLMKLGTELHQPKNYLDINRQHVLFIQELSADSAILNLMQNYEQIKSSFSAPESLPVVEDTTTTPDTSDEDLLEE